MNRRGFLKLLALAPLAACLPKMSGGRDGAIQYVLDSRIFVGQAGGDFGEEDVLTRAEAAVLMVRLKHGVNFVPDIVGEHWGEKWALQAIKDNNQEEGVLEELDNPANRGDIAVLLALALNDG